jgi:hypothetical protein
MNRKYISLSCFALAILTSLVLLIGDLSGRRAFLLAAIALCLAIIDLGFSDRSKDRLLAWAELLIGLGMPVLQRSASSLPLIQAHAEGIERFSFLFLMLWFFGAGMLLWLAAGKPERSAS